jgi:predicted Rossmann fold nucleotide-binding protein DprA/Smf involved in DNA uptake
MCERNLYMASKSSLIIAVADGRAGGTTNTIKLAQKQGKRVFILSP